MKKLIKLFTVVVLVLGFTLPAMAQNPYDYWAKVYRRVPTNDGTISLTPISTGVQFVVLTAGSNTLATLTQYNDDTLTSVTNPVTAANFASTSVGNGQVQFRTQASSVDIMVTDNAGGFTAFLSGFTPANHRIVIDESPNIMHHGAIWYSCTATTELNSGVAFSFDTFLHDARLQVVTTSTAGTFKAGLLSSETNGSATGLINAISAATAGYIDDAAVPTNGTTMHGYWPATTYGAMLATAYTGSDASNSPGGIMKKGYWVTGGGVYAHTLTYTCSTTTNNGAGILHYWFTRIR